MIMVGASAYPRVIDFPRIRAAAEPRRRGHGHRHGAHRRPGGRGRAPEPRPALRFRHDDDAQDACAGPRSGMVLCTERYAKDLDKAVFPGLQGGPLVHVIAAKAVCLKDAAEPAFAAYQRQIVANANRLAGSLVTAGFRLVSGGTDNHLMLVDVFSKGITGKVAEAALGKAGITVNKNAIPFDRNPPMVASGIRIGTPAVTTRGMREAEMETIAEFIVRALKTPGRRPGAGRRSGTRSKRFARSSPCIRTCRPDGRHRLRQGYGGQEHLEAAVGAVFAPGGPLARHISDFEPRERTARHGGGRRARVRGRRRPARRGGHRHGKDARLPGAGRPQPRTRPDFHRHEEPAGTDLLQGHSGAARRARHPVHRDVHEGPRELPVPPSSRSAERRCERGGTPLVSSHDVFLPIIRDWSATTETGDRAEIEDLPEDLAFWNEVSATAETCLGTECPRYDDCFVTRMRQRAAASDVVIVNHHLLCADAAVRQHAFGEVIPACSRAIVDEAHQLEDVATQYFGFSVSTYRVEELARDVERLSGGRRRSRGHAIGSPRPSTGCAITRAPSSPSWPSRTGAASGHAAKSASAPRRRRCCTRARPPPT